MDFLKLNQKLQIIYKENKDSIKSCVSQVMDYDNKSMLITEPFHKGKTIYIPMDTDIEVLAIDQTCIYSFKSIIQKRLSSPPSLWINLPESYNRVQRREYVRVNINLPIIINFIGETEVDEKNTAKNVLTEQALLEGYFSSSSIDLSGGGIKFFGPIKFKEETNVNILLRLPMKEISAICKVIRSEVNEKISTKEINSREFAKYHYITALTFDEIDDSDISTIIQLCFKRQLELKQRGML